MTLPEQQPDANAQPLAPESAAFEPLGAAAALFARGASAIDIDELDKENKGWVVKYLDGLKLRLATEQGADQPDFVMIAYLLREQATYQELLERTEKK